MIRLTIRFIAAIITAFASGKLISKLKLPSILGWLIAGMVLGPHALALVNNQILDAPFYQNMVHILECAVGLMIGTELVWDKIKRSGKSIVITTLTQSLGTFLFVTLVFGTLFHFMNIPLYLAFLFGGIALATAPAPALSIVREFKTDGPVTSTLIPMAALDDIVGCVVFFTTIAIVAGNLSAGSLSFSSIALVVILPLVIGAVTGIIAGFILKQENDNKTTFLLVCITILMASAVGFVFNNIILPKPVLNFMLIGMAFSAAFANMISEKRLEQIMQVFNPFLGLAMIVVILNLGAPLDYHLILGAGLFTVIYIASRAFGKYFGAYFGASITKSPETVKKYLGLTLLPHSGVSLVFTGIAVNILIGPDPESAQIIQGTIAAAAVINEIIAVIMAKKGFEWAGEFHSENSEIQTTIPAANQMVITISREYGSGGREIGERLSKELNLPFYDHELIELAAKNSPIDISFFENSEKRGNNPLYDLSFGLKRTLTLDDKVFLEQAKVIREIAEQGGCIIVGRCADHILKGHSRMLRTFIYADIEFRKERIINVYKEASEKAMNELAQEDKRRTYYYNNYTGEHLGDMKNYDICLNSSLLGIDQCVEIIKSAYLEEQKKVTL